MSRDSGGSWLLIGIIAALVLAGGGVAGVAIMSLGKLNASQIMTYAENAGFAGQDLITAVAVALAESSGNPDAFGDAGIGQGSFGLWQISSKYHPEYGPDFSQLYDPEINALAAYSIYAAAGNSFTPWSTFNPPPKGTGTYVNYIPAATEAANA